MTDATRQRIPESRAPQSRAEFFLRVDQLSDAVEQLARDCSISPRQAYRYLEQAQSLKQPVPPSESKLAFTVKLPHSLGRDWRRYAIWPLKARLQQP